MIGKGKSISHGVAALEYDLAKEIEDVYKRQAYNRQGEIRGKQAENQLEKRGKSKATPTNGR